MDAETIIQPVNTQPIEPTVPPVVAPQVAPAPVPQYIPRPKSSRLPLIFGFLIVIAVAAVIGFVYYKNQLTVVPVASPSATPMASPTLEPSSTPSATLSATPSATPKSSIKPVTAIPKVSSPTPTPVSAPTFDLRFGNPSANIKQTIDEGTGEGRVINREYSSVQSGQFDEVSSTWSPKVTICFHIVANEEVIGKNVKFSFSLDDKIEVEADLGQYDKLVAGRIYDWCHDVTGNIGKHTTKLLLNADKSLKEFNYTDDLARLEYENLADKIAPNFTLMGPINEGASGTCLFPQYVSDNVTAFADLRIEQKIDTANWTKFDGNRYCFIGASGTSHSFAIKITDARGNASEQSKTFVLY